MDGGSLGRYGSSGSCLDGVPFKIGPKFRPPPKIIYQPIIKSSCAQGSKEEYTFKTEEGVLAWAKAREEALKKAAVEQEERAAKAAACVKNNDKSIESDEQNRGDGKSGNVNNNGKDTSQDPAIHHQDKVKPPVPTKPPTQKVVSEPGAILKPTPIQPLNKVSQQNGSASSTNPAFNSAFDVSMFERVDDPFETLELQTIDDMEELKVLLDSSSSSSKDNKESSEKVKCDATPPNSNKDLDTSEGIYDLAAPVTSCWVKFDSDDTNTRSDSKTFQDSARSSESPARDIGEYVDIVEEKGVTFKPVNGVMQDTLVETSRSDQFNSNSNALSGPVSKSNTASGIYRPVLPPIPANHMKISNGNADVETNSLEQNNSNPFLNSLSLAASTTSESQQENIVSTNSVVNTPKPLRIPPPPPFKPNRPVPIPRPRPNSSGQMWSSAGPSLADSFESSPKSPEVQIHNPYSRHSMNQSNPDLSQEMHLKLSELTDNPSELPLSQLNKYRPLPPTPSPRSFVEKGNQSLGLTDPYISLSRDAQAFTDRITSMGFLRAKVARAVEKFGQDEKEVLDHLFAVDVLVEKKYAPIHAEAALNSCKNDVEKAERLLELQHQLEQLGFSSENVRDALVKSDMDHDKALDLLTA